MPSRRVFLQTGLTASIAPWVLPWRPPAPSAARVDPAMSDVYGIYKVVADVRFAPAELFAREASCTGSR
jgi:hypothetical protein